MFSYILSKRPVKNYFVGSYFFLIFVQTLKMDKQSNHWGDVIIWLEKVAKSCQTKEQAENCERLVWNFHRKYQKKLGLAECFDLTKEIDKILLEFKLPAFYKKQKL